VNRVDLPAPIPAPGRPLLVVTGFMGTGKTEAGRRAAAGLGLPFIDLDEVIGHRAGRPAPAVFSELGQTAFRALERAAVTDATRLSAAVVATGGGAPVDPKFAALARIGEVAVLSCDPDELATRLGDGSGRPLLGPDPRRRIRELLADRARAYAAAGPALDTTGSSPEEVAAILAQRYQSRVPAGSPAVVTLPAETTDVLIGTGTLGALGPEAAGRVPGARTAAVIADATVGGTARRAAASLAGTGLRVIRVDLPPGEEAKTMAVVGEVWSRLREGRVEPTDLVVAVGGGAALDAAGFAAATYARGVALVNVPTTLLAMVDAAVGGKVAVDHAGVKNLAGAFHHPRLVVADPDALVALPARERRAGLAEVVKAAVLASPLLLDLLELRGPVIRSEDDIEWLVEQAVRIKAAYVSRDPRDGGIRRSLNLGHTFAHAIEAASGHTVPHGEAVAAGLVAAARLGARAGVTEPELAGRLADLLEALGLPATPPPELPPDALLEAMAADKKRRSGWAVFVVPAVGGAALLEGVEEREALASLRPERAVR
jgi:shikimate kinase / 3-dehydroquinate synthase